MKVALASMLMAAPGLAAAPSAQPAEIRPAGEPWHLSLSLGDLTPVQGYPSRQDREVRTYRNGSGVTLSVIVENARAPATLASCRNVFARRKQGRGSMIPINESQREANGTVFQEYDLSMEAVGKSGLHHNIHSCRARGTYYIDVHASKANYRPADRAALLALVNGVTIVD